MVYLPRKVCESEDLAELISIGEAGYGACGVAFEDFSAAYLLGKEEDVAGFSLPLDLWLAGVLGENTIADASNGDGSGSRGVGADELVDLRSGEVDGGWSDAQSVDRFEAELPLTVDLLPGLGHEEVAVRGAAGGTSGKIVLMQDGGGIADAMDGEGPDDEGCEVVHLELVEEGGARGNVAILDVNEVGGGGVVPELAITAMHGV